MANVRYWQVHLLHTATGITEVIGVVAEGGEAAAQTCQQALGDVQILAVHDRGHVRFIRHTMVGPATKTFVNGEPVNATPVSG